MPGQRVRHPALPLRHRHDYAVVFTVASQPGHTRPQLRVPHLPKWGEIGAHRKPANPPDYSWHPVKRRNNTGSLRIPSRLAHRTRPVRQYRADATLSRLLSPRTDDPRPRLPPASPRRYDSEETAVSHPRPGAPAPRGAQHGTIADHVGSSVGLDLVEEDSLLRPPVLARIRPTPACRGTAHPR